MSDYYPSYDSGSFLSFASVRLGKAEAKVLSIVIITVDGRGYRNRGSLVGRTFAHKHELRVRNGQVRLRLLGRRAVLLWVSHRMVRNCRRSLGLCQRLERQPDASALSSAKARSFGVA